MNLNLVRVVEEKDGRIHKHGDVQGVIIPLLLYEEQYMLNERIKISPYYINHFEEINTDKNASKWPLERRQLIDHVLTKNGK